MFWTSSCGRIELQITKAQAAQGSHQGQCGADIAELRTVPSIRRQLNKINPTHLTAELRGYGAWDDAELRDHQANLDRLLWIAAGDIVEGNT
jgi:hypothetical protein